MKVLVQSVHHGGQALGGLGDLGQDRLGVGLRLGDGGQQGVDGGGSHAVDQHRHVEIFGGGQLLGQRLEGEQDGLLLH